MSVRPTIRELNARCDSSPVCAELWVEAQWRFWKYALRAVGKRDCVEAVIEAVGRLDIPCSYPNYIGNGNLAYEVHDRIKNRLCIGLIDWVKSDNADSRRQVAEALSEYNEAVAVERDKGWFVVSSNIPPVNVFVSLAEAVNATSSFEVYIRQALVQAASVSPGSVERFRHQLSPKAEQVAAADRPRE